MKKQLLAGALALAMGITPALAAETAFPAVNAYPGFADVADGDWYADTVKLCYEVGLMKGKESGFDPNGVMTVAECAAIAARIHNILDGGDGVIENPEGAEHWFTGAMTYLQRLAGQAEDQAAKDVMSAPLETATRQDFFTLLALAVPEGELSPSNAITGLPDTDDADVLAFYNAGILTGVNDYGAFAPNKGLSRAEVAAMAARIARPELRTAFVPKKADPSAEDFDLADYLLGVDGSAAYFTCGGVTVTVDEFLSAAITAADRLYQLCQEQGVEFGWNNTIGTGKSQQAFADYVYRSANTNALQAAWEASALAPNPSEAEFAQWEAGGMLKARHILVKDKDTAAQIYAQLLADPDQFEVLMERNSEDGRDEAGRLGAASYVFGPKEMVSEFEEGTKALQPGEIGAPVESQFGFHIIQRLPLTLEDYREKLLDSGWNLFFNGPVQEQGITFSDAFAGGIDVPQAYGMWRELTSGD